jgi:hypothetical protein
LYVALVEAESYSKAAQIVRIERVFMSPRRAVGRFLSFLFLLSVAVPLLAVGELSPSSGLPGQTLTVRYTVKPLPASGAVTGFFGTGLSTSNLRNDSSGFFLFDVTIATNAPLGPQDWFYAQASQGTITVSMAFTVSSPTGPTPTPTSPFPTPTPTSPPFSTPTPTRPASGTPTPTPLPGSLRIAPDQITEGTQRVRLIIAGSDFTAGTSVQTPPDIRLDSLAVLSPTRLELFVSNALGTPSGPRVFAVSTPAAGGQGRRPQDSSGTVVVTVMPAHSLGAHLSVTTAAVVSPQAGSLVAEGERVYARGLLATTGTGVILGSWQLDDVPFDRFEAYASAGSPVEVTSQVPIPLDTVGNHELVLAIDHPQDLRSDPILVVRVPQRAAQMRTIEPIGGAVVSAPPRFRWTLVPGAQSYEVVISQEADEASAARFRVADSDWTPSGPQWRALGEGLRFWAVRAIFPVDVRGVLTPWRQLAAAPGQVRLEVRPVSRDAETGLPVLSWTGGAVGLVYRVAFYRTAGEAPFYRGLTAQPSYLVRQPIAEAAAGPVFYRVEALVPGGAAIGESALERLEWPPGLLRARQSAAPVPTAAELAALERQLLAEDEDPGISYDWKVDVTGMVVFRSSGPPVGTDTAYANISSASNITGQQWKVAETVELAAHDDISPQRLVQDSRNWVVRGGGGGAVRADAMVGYAPPSSLDGLQLLSGGLTRGGAEARLTTPVGAFGGYTSWDDRFLGVVSSVFAPEQRLRMGSYDLPLPADRFLVRGVYLNVANAAGGPAPGATSELWGGLGRYSLSPAFTFTFEGAHSKLEPGAGGPSTEGNAFRANAQGTAGSTSYAVNFYDTKATFSNPANQGLTMAGQPDRLGGDALVLQRFGRFMASATYRYLETNADGAHGKSQAINLTVNAPLVSVVRVSATGLWSLDRGDATNGVIGLLPRTDRESYGGQLGLTETLGRLILVESATWTRLRDDVSSANSATTKGVTLFANGAIAPWLLLSASVIATRNELPLSGNNDTVVAFVQPRLIISSIRLTFAPRAAYNYIASGASPNIARGEQYQALLSWSPALAPVQPTLGVAGDWSRNRFGPASPTGYTGRFTATLALRWGAAGGKHEAPKAAGDDLPAPLDSTFRSAALPGLAPAPLVSALGRGRP